MHVISLFDRLDKRHIPMVSLQLIRSNSEFIVLIIIPIKVYLFCGIQGDLNKCLPAMIKFLKLVLNNISED